MPHCFQKPCKIKTQSADGLWVPVYTYEALYAHAPAAPALVRDAILRPAHTSMPATSTCKNSPAHALCSKVLDKYEIGQLAGSVQTTAYQEQGTEDALYEELKRSVNQYFRNAKVHF